MIYAGVLAGGVGSRMGADMPKQFLEVCGKPIIIHTIERFLECRRFEKIYVATHKSYVSYMSELATGYFGENSPIVVIEGGSDRNGSIVCVINEIRKTDSSKDSILVTHDSVRPFVTAKMIEENIAAARNYGAAGTFIPTTDTIIRSFSGDTIDEIPLRDELYNAQTPQTFRIGLFEDEFYALSDEQKLTLTDACKIFVLAGRQVKMVMGDNYNIKITTPVDMRIAEAIIAERDK